MTNLLITNVRPMGLDATRIVVTDGRITAISADAEAQGHTVLDGAGRIALPGLVEAHTHLDKNLIGMGWYRNEVGPRLIDKIDNERAERIRLGIDAKRQSARQIAQSVSYGTTHIRTHVDVDTETGIKGIVGLMATRAELADYIDIDIVAFPQSGLLVRPGTLALLDDALREGAEVVGGLDPSVRPASAQRDHRGVAHRLAVLS